MEVCTQIANGFKPFIIFTKSSILNTRFFYKQRFSSTQPQCCLTFFWVQLQMLDRYWTIFVSMSRPTSIYVASMWSIFYFQPNFNRHYSYNIIKTNALAFCTFFISYYFWMITWMKKVKSFPIVKFQRQSVA